MDIEIKEQEKELQVQIKCKQKDTKVERLKSHIELFDQKLQGKNEQQIYNIDFTEVLYFETVDNRAFMYTDKMVLDIKYRLYELEVLLPDKDFIRISKSQIVNVNKIRSIRPEINRTMLLTMCNDEQIYVSRKYVKPFRALLSI